MATTELDAELPPQPAQRVALDLRVTPGGVSLSWEAGAARGMLAGPADEVARAVGALVLRLAGGAPQAVEDAPTTPVARG